MSYKIYSIVYDINQCSEYERYDNSHIKTIEDKSYLFEYNPIIDITSKQIEEEYLGIFSYKFYIKKFLFLLTYFTQIKIKVLISPNFL